MSGFRFAVADDVFETHPNYIVCWIAAAIDPSQFDTNEIPSLLRAAEQRVRTIYAGKDLKDFAAFSAWRSAFSRAGWSASKYPSSVEALTKRVLRGHDLPSIHPVVDIANATSLTYAVPVGCHDMKASPTLDVRPAKPGDTFVPLGGDAVEELEPGEIVYAHQQTIRTRRWVWRQSRDALVTPETSLLFLPIDGFSGETEHSVEAAQEFLAATLKRSGVHWLQSGVINATQTSIDIDLATG